MKLFSAPQPGTGLYLDAIREVILQRLVYRNFGTHETLLGVFATNRNPATTGGAVEQGTRWFELRRSGGGAWGLHDEGTFGGDSNSPTANLFLGSAAMDSQGNMALGYSKTDVGASPVYPSLGFAGRLAIDPAGTLGPENLIVPGGGPSSSGRWGDYAAMSIDPADDCTFWFTSLYIPNSGTWGTRINSFSFAECAVGFNLTATPQQIDVCAPTDPDPTFSIGVTSVGGWSFAVDLSSGGEPPGTTSSFVPDNQLPDFSSTYRLLGTGGSTTGTYLIDIIGTGGDLPATIRSKQVLLNLAVTDPGAPTLTSPADGAAGTSLSPTFSWNASSDAMSYTLEVATDAGFTSIVYSATDLPGPSHPLPSMLVPGTVYYWRVRASNVCGNLNSQLASFITADRVCEIFSSADVPKAIPEGGGSAGTTTSSLTVEAAGATIADVNVLNLKGTHTYMGDLDFFVESPGAISVQIREQACTAADNFDINYDDQAAPGLPPCPATDSGTYRPFTSLAALNNKGSDGDWTLTIVDNFSGDTGQIDSWDLEVCTLLCSENIKVIANQAIAGPEVHLACDSITVGPTVTVESAGELVLEAPRVIFEDGVTIDGKLSVRGP